MNRWVVAGWICVTALGIGWFGLAVRAQSGWPSGNPTSASDCGDPPPEIDDPSPGDGNDCWEYKESDGWQRLFNCNEEIECPEVECTPIPGEGCACLLIGDSADFTFTMPIWTVEPGKKTTEPDNPDCGDAVEEDIIPGESDSWELTGDESAASVSPKSGSGDAEFTVTALDEGSTSFTVTWKYTLSMDENCPKEFSEEGPTVSVDVYEVVPDFPESEDCPNLREWRWKRYFAWLPPPDILHTLEPLQVCFGETCKRWRITGGCYIVFEEGGYRTHNMVTETDCPPPLQRWDTVPREQWRIDESIDHELKHCAIALEDITEINNDIVAPALQEHFSSAEACQARIDELWNSILIKWAECIQAQSDHCAFTGEKRYKVECGAEKEDGEYQPCSQEN